MLRLISSFACFGESPKTHEIVLVGSAGQRIRDNGVERKRVGCALRAAVKSLFLLQKKWWTH